MWNLVKQNDKNLHQTGTKNKRSYMYSDLAIIRRLQSKEQRFLCTCISYLGTSWIFVKPGNEHSIFPTRKFAEQVDQGLSCIGPIIWFIYHLKHRRWEALEPISIWTTETCCNINGKLVNVTITSSVIFSVIEITNKF